MSHRLYEKQLAQATRPDQSVDLARLGELVTAAYAEAEREQRRNEHSIAVMIEEDLFEADAYLPAIPVPADSAAWSLIRWQKNHKADAIVSEAETASELRARLIAMRPH